MAKQSMIQREFKRERTVAKFAKKRTALKAIMKDPKSSDDEIFEAQQKLQKLPRNASPARLHNRCNLTGCPHGFYRKFGLSRNKLREFTMKGELPGLSKASW